ncbi:unnamed protein product [Arabis nemorensis]|uniref:Reverse transcriptase zinc-binding domain-containing protein n=1 Tax=Arabis nemorensis TaxID=586526 RepID=A0A565B013_9BRAS|nr:unnamed protein product [Arabis nemorensis]
MWKKLLKLRPIAAKFLRQEVRDGLSTSFWYDNWLPIGPLIKVLGEVGSRTLGVAKNAKVAEVADESGWKIRRRRGSQLQELLRQISAISLPRADQGEDITLWKQSTDKYEPLFSSKKTWEQLRVTGAEVPWHRLVWVPESVPRQAFITWLAFRVDLKQVIALEYGETSELVFYVVR